jgi:hypothetical protein
MLSEHLHGSHQNMLVSSLGVFLHLAQPKHHLLFSLGIDMIVTAHLNPSFCMKAITEFRVTCIALLRREQPAAGEVNAFGDH